MQRGVDARLLNYTLDTEETSHIDTEEDGLLVSINVPTTEKCKSGYMYTTIPLGMLVVRDDYFITISSDTLNVYERLKRQKGIVGEIATYKKSRLIFQILYITSVDFLRYLSVISKELDKFEEKLDKTITNTELLKLVTYQKTMIYFNTSLKTNQSVMERISRGKHVKIYDEDEDILDDAAIENRQAIEMASTYSDILNGMTDVYGTIVSNNLNNVMKFLTSVTLIMTIPTLISSIMGMNVVFPFVINVYSFWIVMAVIIICTLIATIWLKNKNMLK